MIVKKDIKINNLTGIQLLSAEIISQIASKYSANIWVTKDKKRVNAKSIMGLLALSVPNGYSIKVCGEGKDASQAVHEIVRILS